MSANFPANKNVIFENVSLRVRKRSQVLFLSVCKMYDIIYVPRVGFYGRILTQKQAHPLEQLVFLYFCLGDMNFKAPICNSWANKYGEGVVAIVLKYPKIISNQF